MEKSALVKRKCSRVGQRADLPIVGSVVWQGGNEVVADASDPSIKAVVLSVRIGDFEFDPVSGIKENFVVKLVPVRIHSGNDVPVISFDLVSNGSGSFC